MRSVGAGLAAPQPRATAGRPRTGARVTGASAGNRGVREPSCPEAPEMRMLGMVGGALARAGREIRAVARAETTTHRHLRDRLVAITAVSVVVDLVCGVLTFLFERHAPGTHVHGIGTALFFSSTQLLTVSSQMANPLTTAGRVLDVGMELYAITVVTSLAGSFGAFFHRRSSERRAASDMQRRAD